LAGVDWHPSSRPRSKRAKQMPEIFHESLAF